MSQPIKVDLGYIFQKGKRFFYPFPPPSPPEGRGGSLGEDSLLKLMISVRNPCRGAPPETFAFQGSLERGCLAQSDQLDTESLLQRLSQIRIINKSIAICMFS